MPPLASSDCMTARAIVCEARDGGMVEVELADEPRCRGCEGVCLWRRLPRAQRIELRSAYPLCAGDAVLVSLPARYVLLGALLLYGFPWAAVLVGAFAGDWLTGSDFGVLGGAAAGVAAAFLAAPRLRRRLEEATAEHLDVRAPS